MESVIAAVILLVIVFAAALLVHAWVTGVRLQTETPSVEPPIFVGVKRLPDGNVCAIFQYEGNMHVNVLVDGNVYSRDCVPENGVCEICVPGATSSLEATFTFGDYVTKVVLPAIEMHAYTASITAPLSWDVNVETNIVVSLCNDSDEDDTATLTVTDDGNAFYTGTYTVSANACLPVYVPWTPGYTGTHTLTAAAGGRSVSADVFIGEHVVDYAPSGGGVVVFWVQEALSVGGAKTFWVQEAITGGGWDCNDDLNCFATPLE